MNKDLKHFVENGYGISIHHSTTIHHTRKTLAIKIYTDLGEFLLKTLYKSIDRQLFINGAEEFLRSKGIHIPEILYTKDKQSYLEWDNSPYVLQKWVKGNHYPLISKDRVKRMGALLGKAHAASLGFESDQGSLFLGADDWEKNFLDKIHFIGSWGKMAEDVDPEKWNIILDSLEFFLSIGDEIQRRIIKHPYFLEWKGLPMNQHFLCHGDFHTFNVKVNHSLFHIIDWEDVRYDYPSKDIARLLYVMMRRYKKWDPHMFNLLLTHYLQENPLSDTQMSLLLSDLAFPHIFYRFLVKKIYKKMSVPKISQFITREREKTSFLIQQELSSS